VGQAGQVAVVEADHRDLAGDRDAGPEEHVEQAGRALIVERQHRGGAGRRGRQPPGQADDRQLGGQLVQPRRRGLRADQDQGLAPVGQQRVGGPLAWLIGGDLPIVPLVGASSVAQLDESLAAVDLQLSAEQRQRLDAAD
jgi:aryl-alcohol dehydrogenase-like predicted oxidoreductase